MAKQFNYLPEAIDLIQNEKVIRLKNELIRQLELQLQNLGNLTADKYPELTKVSPPPKVSKGEKHRGLPFVVLDYPRVYGQKDIFAIRTMIWWSKQISVSLILKGKYLNTYFPKLQEKLKEGSMNKLYLSTSGDLWNNELHHQILKSTQIPEEIEFFKLSFKFPLTQLNQMESNYFNSVNHLLSILDYVNN